MYSVTARIKALLLLALCSSTVTASQFDLRVSDDAIQANLAVSSMSEDLLFGGGYFYKDEEEAINILDVDLHAQGRTALGNLPSNVNIGMIASYMKEDAFKASAVALGGRINVNIPEAPGLSLETSFHFAPDVLAFGDSDSMTRAHVQANYRLIQSADVSAGYRLLRAGVKEAGHRTFESGLFLGLRLKF
ncbi:MAG: YfaZ family outer membrane protein [Oleiphilaceae bacterium]|nr:YfaZ family outer membrane protein [Oleiphilaceae bacterium]